MRKKKSSYLKEENLLTLLSQNNFIVPEIQREYVWGENKEVIEKFLFNLKNKIGVCCDKCNLPTSETKINIGFLYSYKPDYVKIEHERFLDENLIDGQQRFTTLFLLLFFSALKENRKNEFLTLIRFEEHIKMSFDIRVRDLTRRFLLELLEKINTIEELKNIEERTWFLADYKNDVSIKSMIKALNIIQTIFTDNIRYYSYIINYIVFWHFKTEATSQGEELYITMNARGEVLADNELTKAAIMIDSTNLYQWGTAWEKWQQFFWKHRNKEESNPNSDKGFNAFLGCIAGLEYYLKEKKGEKAEKDIQKLLSMEIIDNYFSAFEFLDNYRKDFCKNYTYTKWVDVCYSEIWAIFNNNNTDWFADYKDKNVSTERNKMVFIWSWLYYYTEAKRKDNKIEVSEFFRLLRFFYIRFNNNNRSVSTLKKTIDVVLDNGIWNTKEEDLDEEQNPEEETDKRLRTREEDEKSRFFSTKIADENINQFEELVWKIEDHPLNLDGSNVRNINITHLMDLNTSLTLGDFKTVFYTFEKLFPNNTKDGSSTLITILLHYGDFYLDTSYYYKRYDFNNIKKNKSWKNHIRTEGFRTFFDEFKGKEIEPFLEDLKSVFLKNEQYVIKNSLNTLPEGYPLREKIIFYSLFLHAETLWAEGDKIMICDNIQSPRLFKDEDEIIYNSRGHFKSYSGNTDLWEKVREKFEDPLSELKSRLINA